ncbi:sialate O-acetylesterase isoform X6 [Bos javanicus]|uniref:sialate O-acetylesterase isoform X6 n=1 Tax=Bos javanicus TaxID=9906 RepID=UPI002AA8494A|nr:sialate O-acetylesterase isoform X6 [Bos javanicus]
MDYWVPSLSSASQIAGGDPEKIPETKGKGEVSISKRKWGKPPHLSVLLELESMVPVVFSRCRETVSSPVPAPSFHYGGRREARAPRRPRTASRTSGLGRAESELFRPAPRPRPRWRPCPEACAAGTASCQHDCVGICLGSGATVIPAGPRGFGLFSSDKVGYVGFRFASYIDDYMVLQREPAGAVIWGYGTPRATVTVTLCRDQEPIMKKGTRVKADSNTWTVVLDPMKPGGPYEVMAQQTLGRINFTLRVHDVLFGDVWLCSGQSNMKMTVSQVFNATGELSNTAAYQSVRILSVSSTQAQQELEDLAKVDLRWSKPTSKNLGHGNFTYMSAVCWLFGRFLYDTLRYPVGLLSSSWSGTPIEAWSSRRSLEACGVPRSGSMPSDLKIGPSAHSVLWNAMIHPLRNMTLKGVIWYQGTCTIVHSLCSLTTGARPSTMAPRGRQSASSHSDLSSYLPICLVKPCMMDFPRSVGIRQPTLATSPTKGCPTPSWLLPWISVIGTHLLAAFTLEISRRWPTGCTWGPVPWLTGRS